jgi:hypothetical protein
VLSKGQLKSASEGTAVAQARMPSFLARLFGGGKDEDEDTAAAAAAKPARTAAKPTTAANAQETRVEKVAAVPLPQAKPARPKASDRYEVAAAGSEPVAAQGSFGLASANAKPVRLAQSTETVTPTNVSANDIINDRGYWRGLPDAVDSPPVNSSRPAASAPRRAAAVASAQPANTASATPWPLADRGSNEPIPNTLGYAAQPASIATASAVPLALGTSRAAPVAPPDTTVAVKRSDDRPSVETPARIMSVVRVGDRFNEPWMRAMIVSPSAQSFLRTTQLGATDFRNLGPYLLKPTATMLMTFSNDPHRGMTSERFDGSAVVFMSTATFSTASLR